MSQTSAGMKSVASRVSPISTAVSSDMACSAKSFASSPASTFLEKSGMKAMLNAPSAKKRRNMLGREKATTKASAAGPAPR